MLAAQNELGKVAKKSNLNNFITALVTKIKIFEV